MNDLGIHARVNAVVRVSPDDASLFITLRIAAKNDTPNAIELTEPYCLPPISGVLNFRAWDSQGELAAIAPGRTRGVRFRRDARIPPHKEYSWTVEFNCPGQFRRLGKYMAGPYLITLQNNLGGCPVNRHDFVYAFIFPKPRPRLSRLVKTVNVIQVNSRQVPASITKRFDATKCTLSFSLLHGEILKITLATSYEFSSIVALSIAVVTTVAVNEYGALFLTWVWHGIKALVGS